MCSRVCDVYRVLQFACCEWSNVVVACCSVVIGVCWLLLCVVCCLWSRVCLVVGCVGVRCSLCGVC